MCRIAGIASPSAPIEELQHAVASMCQALRHGGPDGEGIYTSPDHHLVLGHRRLAILDLEPSGQQPMHYGGGRYTLTYNGEIYNYRELKAELQMLGFAFRSSGDTEVILAAFAAWGTAAFARLSGMFAFALFDAQTADLYLVRDPSGIKPLYYTVKGRTLVFASEMRAFSAAGRPPEPHPHWPVYFMAYGFLPEPVTTAKDIQPLPKGSFLRFNTRTGERTRESFERFSFFEKGSDRQAITRQLRATLGEAVERHLLADAPIGVFLSGGIDSSIITLLAGGVKGEGLNTLSIDFREAAFSEKVYQDRVQQCTRSTHHRHLLTAEEFHFNLPEIIDAMDLPSTDGINTWFIARMAAERGLKAVLSGLGGDELFGGYPSFHRIARATALQALPAAVLRAGRYHRGKRFRRLAFLSLPGIRGQFLFLRGHCTPDFIARYLGMDEKEVWAILEQEPVLPDLHHLTAGNRASWMELNLYMQNQLLRDADVMSMTHGVEIRVPFLDKAFVKLALAIASGTKYGGAISKQLLVDAFADRLPPEVWQRKKMGFAFPFAQWLKTDEWTRARLRNGNRASRALLKEFETGDLPWSGLVIALLLQACHHETEPAFFNA